LGHASAGAVASAITVIARMLLSDDSNQSEKFFGLTKGQLASARGTFENKGVGIDLVCKLLGEDWRGSVSSSSLQRGGGRVRGVFVQQRFLIKRLAARQSLAISP